MLLSARERSAHRQVRPRRHRRKPRGVSRKNFIGLGNRFLTEPNIATAERLNKFSLDRGHKLVELAMSWLAAQPVVSGIIAGRDRNPNRSRRM